MAGSVADRGEEREERTVAIDATYPKAHRTATGLGFEKGRGRLSRFRWSGKSGTASSHDRRDETSNTDVTGTETLQNRTPNRPIARHDGTLGPCCAGG